jgi:RNA polymerase sigma-70 factor, ECF subfamily
MVLATLTTPFSRMGSSAGTMSVQSDEILVARTLNGELTAFEQLVERHRDVVFRVAARIAGRDDAADVSQDAFLRAFHRLDRFRGQAPFRSWLLRITQNAARDQLARRQRHSTQPLDDEQLPSDRDPDRQPVTRLETRERRQRLERKLELLREDYRSLLVLRDLEQLPYEEIAETLEMPLGSVKGRLHRARGDLIELLRNNTYDWELPE